jgi:hypothetical protein
VAAVRRCATDRPDVIRTRSVFKTARRRARGW